MGESPTSHPYRPEPPGAAAPAARDIRWWVALHILSGGMSCWFVWFFIGFSAIFLWPAIHERSLPGIVITSLFLAFPLAMMVVLAWQGRRSLHLLRTGKVGYAKLIARHVVRDSEHDTYNLTFELEHRGTKHHVKVSTGDPAPLTDDAREQIVFDPACPEKGQLVDELPGKPRVLADGSIAGRQHVAGAAVAGGLMVAAVAGHVVAAWLWLR